MHTPIFVIKLMSTETLDITVDKITSKLEITSPQTDLLRYMSLHKASVILLDELEHRMRLLYGVDIGQVNRGAFDK